MAAGGTGEHDRLCRCDLPRCGSRAADDFDRRAVGRVRVPEIFEQYLRVVQPIYEQIRPAPAPHLHLVQVDTAAALVAVSTTMPSARWLPSICNSRSVTLLGPLRRSTGPAPVPAQRRTVPRPSSDELDIVRRQSNRFRDRIRAVRDMDDRSPAVLAAGGEDHVLNVVGIGTWPHLEDLTPQVGTRTWQSRFRRRPPVAITRHDAVVDARESPIGLNRVGYSERVANRDHVRAAEAAPQDDRSGGAERRSAPRCQ